MNNPVVVSKLDKSRMHILQAGTHLDWKWLFDEVVSNKQRYTMMMLDPTVSDIIQILRMLNATAEYVTPRTCPLTQPSVEYPLVQSDHP